MNGFDEHNIIVKGFNGVKTQSIRSDVVSQVHCSTLINA